MVLLHYAKLSNFSTVLIRKGRIGMRDVVNLDNSQMLLQDEVLKTIIDSL